MASLTLTTSAEALFASDLSAWSRPTAHEVAAAISEALTSHGGFHGCMGAVAAAYGEHPETAAPRMRWARRLIETIYPSETGVRAMGQQRRPVLPPERGA